MGKTAMHQKSKLIALGGIFSALCVTLMFFTGLVPFGGFFLPMAAGAMLLPVVVELGCKPAVIAYISTSLLCALMAPDRQAVMVFIALFGYYPIVKQKLEQIQSRAIEYFCKLLLFNISMAAGLAVMAYVFGVAQVLQNMGNFGKYTVPILWAAGNIVFALYDLTLTKFYILYMGRLRPILLRRPRPE